MYSHVIIRWQNEKKGDRAEEKENSHNKNSNNNNNNNNNREI